MTVEVTDVDALARYAAKRYAECWDDGLSEQDFRDDPALAVKEALVISNENLNTTDYGIEIVECEAVAD